MQYSYNYADYDYRTAVNCEHTQYYNPPITILIDNDKYILPFGTMDNKFHLVENNMLHIVAVNYDLSYASLAIIDPADKSCMTAYCDPLKESFFDLELNEQIRYLSNYLPA